MKTMVVTGLSATVEDPQAREAQHQLVAALVLGQGVQLVQDHPAEAAEDLRRLLVGEHQGQRLGRRQQDMRRVGALAGALGRAGVAGPVLDPDLQTQIGYRPGEVTGDVRRQRLQGRDVERMQPRRRIHQIDEAGQEARQRLAPAGRRDQQAVALRL
jgi:hypothetical protein